jgi:hypothetical protein
LIEGRVRKFPGRPGIDFCKHGDCPLLFFQDRPEKSSVGRDGQTGRFDLPSAC